MGSNTGETYKKVMMCAFIAVMQAMLQQNALLTCHRKLRTASSQCSSFFRRKWKQTYNLCDQNSCFHQGHSTYIWANGKHTWPAPNHWDRTDITQYFTEYIHIASDTLSTSSSNSDTQRMLRQRSMDNEDHALVTWYLMCGNDLDWQSMVSMSKTLLETVRV